MAKVVIVLPKGDLASRTSAASVRIQILQYFAHSERLEFDCSQVEDMSESFADEVFGILVVKFGFESVISRIKISGAKPDVLLSIASVMRRRKNQAMLKRVEHRIQHATPCVA